MLVGHFKLLHVRELEARGDYPASLLVTLYDADSSDTLTLIASQEMKDRFSQLDEFADVTLRLRWHRISLASVGSGKGNAYRLRIVEEDLS
jgi:hypothetical protein